VRATLGIGPGASILWVDTAAAEARLEADPRVARATVGRALPWTLTIDVEERSPVAVVRTPAGDLLVAGDGTVLGPGARRARLPRILVPAAQLSRGARPVDVAALARVVRTLPPGVRAAVATVATDATGSVVLRIAGGPRVVFGVPDDVHAKTTALREVLAWARRARVELRAISVVSPTAPAAVVVSS
jgi:cell division protein FtsQ